MSDTSVRADRIGTVGSRDSIRSASAPGREHNRSARALAAYLTVVVEHLAGTGITARAAIIHPDVGPDFPTRASITLPPVGASEHSFVPIAAHWDPRRGWSVVLHRRGVEPISVRRHLAGPVVPAPAVVSRFIHAVIADPDTPVASVRAPDGRAIDRRVLAMHLCGYTSRGW